MAVSNAVAESMIVLFFLSLFVFFRLGFYSASFCVELSLVCALESDVFLMSGTRSGVITIPYRLGIAFFAHPRFFSWVPRAS